MTRDDTPTQVPADRVSWNLREASQVTGITLWRLEQACKDGDLPHTVYRGLKVVTRTDLEVFLARFRADNQTNPSRQTQDDPRITKARERALRANGLQPVS